MPDWPVGDGVLSQVVTHFLEVDPYLDELDAVEDMDNLSHHLGEDDDVSGVSPDGFFFGGPSPDFFNEYPLTVADAPAKASSHP